MDETATPNSLTGTFTYEGRTGGVMRGSYEGTLETGVIEADVTIDRVDDVQAVQEEPAETSPGGGTMTGITEADFQYTIEGWLFQRIRKPVMEGSP